MALELGTLVAFLKTDDSQLGTGLAKARGKVGTFGKHLGTALKGAGLAAGALLAAGLAQNLEIGAGRAKLAAQLDLTSEDSARIGGVAGQVYADNWGSSLDEVNDAIHALGMNLGDVTKMSSGELKGLTEDALALSSTFGVDVAGSTEAVGKMIKNGMAKNATEAFDIITTGMQHGLDRSGDFLDTINEYSPQFHKLGIDGAQMLTILQTGLKAGARDTDTIADAFKEFSLRAIDGSKTTAQGFKDIGLNAKTAAETIAHGGPAAASMTQEVLKHLNAIKDPVKRNAAGVALFGTQWEDTLRQILPAMTNVTQGMDGVSGSTQRMADTAGSSAQGKIDGLKRSFEQWVQAQASSSSALGTFVTGLVSFGGPALAAAGTVGQIAAGLAAFNAAAAAGAIKTAIVTAATKGWAAAQWLLNVAIDANPIGLIIIAIVALVAIFIYAWKHSETFRNVVTGTWKGIQHAALAVFGWIRGYISDTWHDIQTVTSVVWKLISGYVRSQVNIIKSVVHGVIAVATFFRSAFEAARNAVVNRVSAMVSFVRSIPGKILGAIGNLNGLLANAGRRLIDGFIGGITSGFDRVRGTLGRLTDMIPSWKGPQEVDDRLLTDNGHRVIAGFVRGLRAAAPTVRDELRSITESIPDTVSPVAAIPTQRALPAAQRAHSDAEGRRGDIPTVRFAGPSVILDLLRKLVDDHGGGSVQVAFGRA